MLILALTPPFCKTAMCALHKQDTLCKLEEKFENTNFGLRNQTYGVLFFQMAEVPYERIETPNH